MKACFSLPIRLLSHNIRYATQSPFKGEELWPVRAPRLINELRYNTLYNSEAFVCLQEVLDNQLHEIIGGLNNNVQDVDKWAYIGVGRDDGKAAGEYSPILYRSSVWKLEHFKTVWLSETPDRPSKGWDAASIRIVTIGTFVHRNSGKKLVAMNTHMDDQGKLARLEGAKLIVKEIEKHLERVENGLGLPVLLAGDFNSEPHQEAYKVLNASTSPVQDLRDSVSEEMRYGHDNTFTGFGYEDEPNKRIDFLFLLKGLQWKARGYAVLESRFDDGVYISDHRAVVGDVELSSDI